MESVIALLTQAREKCTSQRDLAKHLQCSEQNLYEMLRGKRHLTPQQCILLANLLTRSAQEILALDACCRARTEAERERLRAGFFTRAVGAVAICATLGALVADYGEATVYTLSRLLLRLRRCRWSVAPVSFPCPSRA